MARTKYAPDRGLTVRMTVTMFLLGLVFVAFVAAIIGIMTAVHASGASIVLIALIFGGGSAIASLFYSDKIALAAAGAQIVTPQQAPELHAIVDRLCALADMDKPRVAIAPTNMPNAFATGRNSKNSVLCVTEGLLYRSKRRSCTASSTGCARSRTWTSRASRSPRPACRMPSRPAVTARTPSCASRRACCPRAS